ncbi:MAG TPA: hypothetical protein DGR27_05320 [Eubacterium sp.]|jgi:hypothetical protein|nr:MAG TPA: hypothetical protein [Caudoviricetes sp.]HAS70582.1 hypothetical protein [Eubacterium sp.]HCW37921.1 hypothetical protein [Eubacterium sp.]
MAVATKKDSKSSTKTSAAKSVEDIKTGTEDNVMDASVEDIISDDSVEDSASEVLPECLNLYAKADILYSSHQYSLGEELPTDNPQMIDAWLRADTAEWR